MFIIIYLISIYISSFKNNIKIWLWYMLLFSIASALYGIRGLSLIAMKTALQPLHALAFANGTRMYINWGMKALSVALVGIYWQESNYQCYFWVPICFCVICCFVILVTACAETINNKRDK